MTYTALMRDTPERTPVVIAGSYDLLALRVARRIAALIAERHKAGLPTVLGLATGSTPIGIYRELIRMHRDEGLDWSRRALGLGSRDPMFHLHAGLAAQQAGQARPAARELSTALAAGAALPPLQAEQARTALEVLR